MAEVGSIRAKIILDNSGFTKGMDDAKRKTDEMKSKSANLKKELDGIQKASAIVATSIVAAIGTSVMKAGEFEQGMAKVKAVSQASAEEMVRLEEVARRMGAETQFSATQASEALAFLAQSGFSVEQQISALPAVLNAAAAGQIELGQAADIVSNVMSSFGIEAEDAEKAVDVLVKTAATANVDIPMMGESMKMVAPVAKSLGFSIEETAAAIGILGSNGLQGSQSGTILRAAMLSLANPVGAAATAIEELGIEVQTADGSMKPLPELVGHIGEKLAGMGDAQKTATAAQLVGTEAAAGLISLLEVGEDGLANYTSELENSAGAAQEMADIQNDTLQGSFKAFQSALEEVGIEVGQQFLPMFRDMIDVGADVVRWVGELDGKMIASVATFTGVAAAVAGVITTVAKLSAALSLFALSPVGAAIIGVSLLAGGIAALNVAKEDTIQKSIDQASAMQAEYDTLDAAITRYDELKASTFLTNDELKRFIDIADELSRTTDTEKIARLKDEQALLQEKSNLTNDELAEFISLNNEILEVVPESSATITDEGNAFLDTTAAAKELNAEKLEGIRLTLEGALAEAEADQRENLKEQKRLREELNEGQEIQNQLVAEEREKRGEVGRLQEELTAAEEASDFDKAFRLAQELADEQANLSTLEDQREARVNNNTELQEELDKVNEKLSTLEETRQALVNNWLAQTDLTAEAGEEVAVIEESIGQLKAKRSELEKNTPAAAKTTQEYQEGISAIDGQIANLQIVLGEIAEITGQAVSMNDVLGRSIIKNIEIRTSGRADLLSGPQRVAYHGGGVVGKPSLNKMPLPKLHKGGMPWELAANPIGLHTEDADETIRMIIEFKGSEVFNVDFNFEC